MDPRTVALRFWMTYYIIYNFAREESIKRAKDPYCSIPVPMVAATENIHPTYPE
jgi:hypothetical protein